MSFVACIARYDIVTQSVIHSCNCLFVQVNTLLFRMMHTRGEEMDIGQDEPLLGGIGGGPPAAGTAPGWSGTRGGATASAVPPGSSSSGGNMNTGGSGGGISWLNEEHIARQCPDVASHSVHLPLLDGANPVFRFLRYVGRKACLSFPRPGSLPWPDIFH